MNTTSRNQNAEDMLRVLEAVRFATEMHGDQKRAGDKNLPYVVHVFEVAELVASSPTANTEQVIAALLHDVVEDTEASLDQVSAQFGELVASLVAENTDPEGMNQRERKARQLAEMPKKSAGARLIKMADLLSNTRGLLTSPPNWRRKSLQRYARANKAIFEAGRGTCPFLEAEWDAFWPSIASSFDLPQR